MRNTLLASFFALGALAAPTSTFQKRESIEITFWTGSECTDADGILENAHTSFDVICGTQMAVPIRSYNMSRNLLANEQLDFSVAAGGDQGTAMQQQMRGNLQACEIYEYSAYGQGRCIGCFTLSNIVYANCANLLINPTPVGVDSEVASNIATNNDPTKSEGIRG